MRRSVALLALALLLLAAFLAPALALLPEAVWALAAAALTARLADGPHASVAGPEPTRSVFLVRGPPPLASIPMRRFGNGHEEERWQGRGDGPGGCFT